jgi:hypothetical protein
MRTYGSAATVVVHARHRPAARSDFFLVSPNRWSGGPEGFAPIT